MRVYLKNLRVVVVELAWEEFRSTYFALPLYLRRFSMFLKQKIELKAQKQFAATTRNIHAWSAETSCSLKFECQNDEEGRWGQGSSGRDELGMVGAGIMIPPIGSLLVTISRSFHSFHSALGPGEIFCLFWPVHLLSWNSYFITNFLSLPSISHHHPQIFFQISSSLCSCTFYICSVLYHPFLHNATSSSF